MSLLSYFGSGKFDALYIGNFKAFGELQRIPLKPITLLFGPNSSGKSSIIHSLAMAHEAQLGRQKRYHSELDIHRTDIGGDAVDLGGFSQYVHGGKYSQQVIWGVEMSVADYPLLWDLLKPIMVSVKQISIIVAIGFELDDEGSPLSHKEPKVKSIEIKLDGEKAVKMVLQEDDEVYVDFVATEHEIFRAILEKIVESAVAPDQARTEDYNIAAKTVSKIFPQIRTWINRLFPTSLHYAKNGLLYDESDLNFDKQVLPVRTGNRQHDIEQVVKVYWPKMLEELIVKSSQNLISHLECLEYLGPLRIILPRHFAFTEFENQAMNHGGVYAWKEIDHNQVLLEKINLWLSSEKLRTPYELRTKRYISTEQQLADSLVVETVLLDKRTGMTVTHRDVGIGISQVLPVLVMAYGSNFKTLAIEQPEIHLHPALQAELGDIFIESALDNKNTLILETHSEHLILRILRRIRETTSGELPEGMTPVRPEDIAVLYIQTDEGGAKVIEIPVTPDGDFARPWPEGFFPERAKELF